MHVDATKGKLYCVGRNNAQFNENTVLQVPVKSTRDVVVVENYPTYQSYTIGGVAATADVNEHRATTDEVAQVAWMNREQIKELFEHNMFVETLEYFFTEVDKKCSKISNFEKN